MGGSLMKYTFNHDEFIINEIPHGVMVIEIKSTEGFFIEKDIFELIKILVKESVTFENLAFEGYTTEEKKEFLDSLQALRIIITIEEE